MATVAGVSCGRCGRPMDHGADEFGPFAHCAPCGRYEYQNVSEDMIQGTYQTSAPKPSTGHFPKDKGCRVSPTCLACPLPDCIQENGSALIRWNSYQRWTKWVQELDIKIRSGIPRNIAMAEVAAANSVEHRSVQRAIQRLRGAG